MKNSTVRTAFIGTLVVIFMLLIVVLALLGHYVIGRATEICPTPVYRGRADYPVDQFLKMLNKSDGLDIQWYHYDGSVEKLKEAVEGNVYQMLSTTVSFRQDSNGLFAGSGAETLLTLTQWLDIVLKSHSNGVQIVTTTKEEIGAVLDNLISRKKPISSPVWLKKTVVGSAADSSEKFARFAFAVNKSLPSAYLALDWSTDRMCSGCFNESMVREMWKTCESIAQPISVVVSVDKAIESWNHLRWLLGKSNNVTMTITDNAPTTWTDNIKYNLLTIRNDFDKSKIFYDFGNVERKAEFMSLAVPAGSALNHFQVNYDARKITWAHAVNSREKLRTAIKDNIMFLEADVLLRGQGTPGETNIPVMAHPPAIDSNITFEQWLDEVVKTDRGTKLDFKSLGAVQPAFRLLNQRKDQLRQPVWINADVLLGPNTQNQPRNATQFINLVMTHFPQNTLSLGWTTGWTNTPSDKGYTEAMVREMHDLCQTFPQPVTFPVRAAAAKMSWCQFQWLLDQSRRYTVTIWTSASDQVTRADMNYVYQHSDKARVYFDVPDELMPDV